MDMGLWEIQKQINDLNREKTDVLTKQLLHVINILEDHEKDMMKMAERINHLEKELSELKGLS